MARQSPMPPVASYQLRSETMALMASWRFDLAKAELSQSSVIM
jgi:hypothetical protein